MGAENALTRIEAGQQAVQMSELTNSGDATVFNGQVRPWSLRGGFEPDVKPNGIINGAAISEGTEVDKVAVETSLVNLNGVETTVAGVAGLVVSRAGTQTHLISSVIVNAAGEYAVEAGTEGTGFVETRGEAGGPPLIPIDAIEVGQVRLGGTAAAIVTKTEIFQVMGIHQERYDYPLYQVLPDKGQVKFSGALPAIHTGGKPKAVYASYAKPIMSDIDPSKDHVLPEETYSLSSEEYYGTAVGSVTRSLGQGSFKTALKNGMDDPIVKLKGERLWFVFLPNRYKPNQGEMYNGVFGIKRNFPTGGAITADCTVSCEKQSQKAEGL